MNEKMKNLMNNPCLTNEEIAEKFMALYKNLNISIQQIIKHMNVLKLKSHKEINKSFVHTFIENDKNDENEFTKVDSKSNMLTRKRSYTTFLLSILLFTQDRASRSHRSCLTS